MQTATPTSPPTLDDLVADPALEEVWVNGPDQVFVADGAAIYASENFDPAQVSRVGSRSRAPLTSSRVEQSASEFLRRLGSEDSESVRLESARTPDGWHAEVTLSSLWSPPVVSEFFPEVLRLRVDARAQTFLR